jgi:hypothetical protein
VDRLRPLMRGRSSRPIRVSTVRFGAVTGRHRGRPQSIDSANPVSGEKRWIRGVLLAAGGVVVVVVLAGAVVGVRGDSTPPGRPQKDVTAQARVVPSPTPVDPTFGEYVPPRPRPETQAPAVTTAPRVRTSAKPTRSPRQGRSQPARTRECPPRWSEFPFLREWCQRNGYRIR